MRPLSLLSLAALSAPLASAAFDGNLNYHSPSTRHVNLGINVPVVTRQSMKRGNVGYQPSELNFTASPRAIRTRTASSSGYGSRHPPRPTPAT